MTRWTYNELDLITIRCGATGELVEIVSSDVRWDALDGYGGSRDIVATFWCFACRETHELEINCW